MTQRERQILNWIEENPLISQQELAEKAGITRIIEENRRQLAEWMAQ
mgnify:CR=1 FL=1